MAWKLNVEEARSTGGLKQTNTGNQHEDEEEDEEEAAVREATAAQHSNGRKKVE